jgi:hypothetical protein
VVKEVKKIKAAKTKAIKLLIIILKKKNLARA